MVRIDFRCPQCQNTPDKHQNDKCEYRFYHDEINEEYGWIAGSIADLIPGEILNEEKAIPVYAENHDSHEWDEVRKKPGKELNKEIKEKAA
jgi:hypothetical protein